MACSFWIWFHGGRLGFGTEGTVKCIEQRQRAFGRRHLRQSITYFLRGMAFLVQRLHKRAIPLLVLIPPVIHSFLFLFFPSLSIFDRLPCCFLVYFPGLSVSMSVRWRARRFFWLTCILGVRFGMVGTVSLVLCRLLSCCVIERICFAFHTVCRGGGWRRRHSRS